MQELGGQDESAESPNSPEGARNTARRMVDLADDLLTAAAVRYTRAQPPGADEPGGCIEVRG